jgi:hypothetical protein
MQAEILYRIAEYMNPGRTMAFVIGMTLTMLPPRVFWIRLWPLFWSGLLGLICIRYILGDSYFFGHRFGRGYFFATALMFGGITYGALHGAGSKMLSALPMRALGRISYSFYLVHYALSERIHLFYVGTGGALDVLFSYVLIFSITVGLSILLFFHVELPYFSAFRSGPVVRKNGTQVV